MPWERWCYFGGIHGEQEDHDEVQERVSPVMKEVASVG